MTTDPFIEAARAEAPPACEHYWISHSQDSALIPWVIRCGSCGAFHTAEMDRAARAHLAEQEPTLAEVTAAIHAYDSVVEGLGGDYAPGTAIRAALFAAWKARP